MSSSADRFTPTQPSQEVRSADAVAMSLPLAGPTSRMLAYLVDWICVSLLLMFLLITLVLGGAGLANDDPIQRAWRDVHAIAQHIALIWDLQGALWGAVALGQPCSDPRI